MTVIKILEWALKVFVLVVLGEMVARIYLALHKRNLKLKKIQREREALNRRAKFQVIEGEYRVVKEEKKHADGVQAPAAEERSKPL